MNDKFIKVICGNCNHVFEIKNEIYENNETITCTSCLDDSNNTTFKRFVKNCEDCDEPIGENDTCYSFEDDPFTLYCEHCVDKQITRFDGYRCTKCNESIEITEPHYEYDDEYYCEHCCKEHTAEIE